MFWEGPACAGRLLNTQRQNRSGRSVALLRQQPALCQAARLGWHRQACIASRASCSAARAGRESPRSFQQQLCTVSQSLIERSRADFPSCRDHTPRSRQTGGSTPTCHIRWRWTDSFCLSPWGTVFQAVGHAPVTFRVSRPVAAQHQRQSDLHATQMRRCLYPCYVHSLVTVSFDS